MVIVRKFVQLPAKLGPRFLLNTMIVVIWLEETFLAFYPPLFVLVLAIKTRSSVFYNKVHCKKTFGELVQTNGSP